MSEQADRIRALLGAQDWAQQVQGRELLRVLGDGALYAEVLAGWAWADRERSMRWTGQGRAPFPPDAAGAIWLDAPLDAPFPPGLALEAASTLTLLWARRAADEDERQLASALEKLPHLLRAREVWLELGEARRPFPFGALPRAIRALVVRGAPWPGGLAGLGGLAGAASLTLAFCELAGGSIPLPPRLARLKLISCWGDLALSPGAGSLRHLELSRMLRARPVAAFRGLRSLSLDDMRAEDLGLHLDKLRDLAALNLDEVDLAGLPPQVLALPRLRWLGLRDNRLTSVPPAVARLTALRGLSLSGNPLEELPPALAGLRELRRLDLGGTRLRALPPWLPQLQRLEALAVAYTPLEELPADLLLSLPRLRALRVSEDLLGPARELAARAREQGRILAVR